MTQKAPLSLIISVYNKADEFKLVLDCVLRQSQQPTEVIIADDGSGDEVRAVVDDFRKNFDGKIKHIWHEDCGNRKTVILNKALAAATEDYIVEIDGDILMSKDFIADHFFMRRKGFYACGSRVMLSEIGSQKVKEKPEQIKSSYIEKGFKMNTLRCRWLGNLIANSYKKSPVKTRGCNFAAWREDLIAVNGWNEDMLGWGFEDSELAIRLHNCGLRKRFLKFMAVCYHIWHRIQSRTQADQNLEIQNQALAKGTRWCENGVDKYLK